MNTRQWLAANGYHDVVALMDEAEGRWKAAGKNTRRSWWETLAGGVGGRPRTVWGVEFPVLAAAQIHEGIEPTDNAIPLKPGEEPPPKEPHGRTLTQWREREAGNS